jgi:hypothetical protein
MAVTTERDGYGTSTPLFGSLAFLLMSFPIGIASLVFVVALPWAGLGLLVFALSVILTRSIDWSNELAHWPVSG